MRSGSPSLSNTFLSPQLMILGVVSVLGEWLSENSSSLEAWGERSGYELLLGLRLTRS